MKTKITKKLFILSLFAIALAFAVAASVYYLRIRYYPEGFTFPLQQLQGTELIVEYIREFCSVIIIGIVAYLAGFNFRQKFAAFMYIFGLWDIFYYIWLYAICQWPHSLLTWDVLFLIPVPWLSPVLAPLLVSLILINAALIIFYFEKKSIRIEFTPTIWAIEILAGLAVVLAFIWNYKAGWQRNYPDRFTWWLFIPALIIATLGFYYPVIKYYYQSNKGN